MTYITLGKDTPIFSNSVTTFLSYCTFMQQRQLSAKWLLCTTRFLRVSEENVRRIQEGLSVAHARQPVERAENFEYRNQLVCVEAPFTIQLSPSF